jgi:hypothetical protein
MRVITNASSAAIASVFVLLVVLCAPATALAQHDHAAMMAAMNAKWKWTVDATGTLNLNIQERKFTDITQVESQNWMMVMGGKKLGKTQLSVHGMFSLEPFTLRDLGSAEVFQTGETFEGLPLIDYQHPHDLFMGLSATLAGSAGKSTMWSLTAAPVGEPTLGPTAFMHRASSEGNPTAPLSHHTVDSTHITHGVVAAGLTRGIVTVEASAFRGREPDEDRLDIEMGKLDSYAGRIWFRTGPWAAQVSGGHLKQPDVTEASDLNRYTASVEYIDGDRPLKFTAVFGMNHHPNQNGSDVKEFAWLADVAWRVRPADLLYFRGEIADKDILEAGGYDPPEFSHAHPLSRVGALTVGYQRRFAQFEHGHIGLGADVTVYRTPANLLTPYGHPVSFHVFLIARGSR